jgi:1-deoxyxylulose-5-phosphate synthase
VRRWSGRASLRRLKTDYVDLYEVHCQDRRTPTDETLWALDDLVRAGAWRSGEWSNAPVLKFRKRHTG